MKNRKNNKGFSLVELIVVVAIMAVLVGVLAPAYLKYVEKSRIQKDDSAIAEVMEAVKIAASEEACYDVLSTASSAIEIGDIQKTAAAEGTNAATVAGWVGKDTTNDDALNQAVAETVADFEFTSKAWKSVAGTEKILVQLSGTDVVVTITAVPTGSNLEATPAS